MTELTLSCGHTDGIHWDCAECTTWVKQQKHALKMHQVQWVRCLKCAAATTAPIVAGSTAFTCVCGEVLVPATH